MIKIYNIFGYNFKGRYSCDNNGNIINNKTNRKLKGFPDGRRGYMKVKLYDGENRGVTLFVHRIICVMFHGEPYDKKFTVNHINGNILNNNEDNLEWVSNLENIRHAIDNNVSDFRSNQLSESLVHTICRMLFIENIGPTEIHGRTGINKTTIDKISQKKNYKRISDLYD